MSVTGDCECQMGMRTGTEPNLNSHEWKTHMSTIRNKCVNICLCFVPMTPLFHPEKQFQRLYIKVRRLSKFRTKTIEFFPPKKIKQNKKKTRKGFWFAVPINYPQTNHWHTLEFNFNTPHTLYFRLKQHSVMCALDFSWFRLSGELN